MKKRNRFFRYVASKKTTGKFLVNILDKSSQEIIKTDDNRALDVCKNCLEKLNFNGYDRVNNNHSTNKEIFNNFDLEDFFRQYPGMQFKIKPVFNEKTAPLDAYSKDFPKISKKLRQSKNWTCENEKCKVYLKETPSFLHVHHLSSKSDNSPTNLRVLCIECHATMPMHEHIKLQPDYKAYMELKKKAVYT
tara:strand:- start:1424 stop:1996 length:573 start_codon:yes stop_codon:yes gene_type:complete